MTPASMSRWLHNQLVALKQPGYTDEEIDAAHERLEAEDEALRHAAHECLEAEDKACRLDSV